MLMMAPKPCCQHVWHHQLHSEHNATHVDGHHLLVVVHVDIDDADHRRRRTRAIDEAIHPTKTIYRVVNHGLTCSAWETSVAVKRALAPSWCSSFLPSSSRRAATTICAPSATKTSAIRLPMPLVPPVIIATLSSSTRIDLSPMSGRAGAFRIIRKISALTLGQRTVGAEWRYSRTCAFAVSTFG